MTLREILDRVARGDIAPEEAERHLDGYGFAAVGFHRLDEHRRRRTGIPEVVFGASKTLPQLREIIAYFADRQLPLLVTKIDDEHVRPLQHEFPQLAYESAARVLRCGHSADSGGAGEVAIVTAGSSDFQVAEEAAATLDFFGIAAKRVYDCGVAGLHRLFASAEIIASADIIIAVAGMEGALPSVLAGLFARPVIAVPTSVGYGASFGGLSALLAMMNSCAPGVTVVNIDNGFGAAVAAKAILRVGARETSVSG